MTEIGQSHAACPTESVSLWQHRAYGRYARGSGTAKPAPQPPPSRQRNHVISTPGFFQYLGRQLTPALCRTRAAHLFSMACCKVCCGCKECDEGEEGKCCCGGQSGECCQVGEYCCSGVCQESPCSPCDAPCAEDCFFEQPSNSSPCDYAWDFWVGTPPIDFDWKTGYPDALDGCTYAWVTVRARSASPGVVDGYNDSACWKVKFRHSLIVCDGETLVDITDQAITVTCSPSATSGTPIFGCSMNAGNGCRSGEYCFGSLFNPNGTGAVGVDCADCSADEPTGDVDFLPDIVCDP